MEIERNKKRNDKPENTIFEDQKIAKLSAKKVLELAKEQEQEKLKKGFGYTVSADGKTRILTKNRK